MPKVVRKSSRRSRRSSRKKRDDRPRSVQRFLKHKSKKIVFDLTYEELYNIVVSVLVVALIFAYNFRDPATTFGAYPQAFVAVAVVVLMYIAAQKFMARRLNCVAFYELWLPGLIVSMLLMIIGLKPIILVGTVSLASYKLGRFGFKSTHMTMTEIGWIGAIGPSVAILLAALFKMLAAGPIVGVSSTFSYMATVSGIIAFFNLLPIKPLDGSKVVLWDPIIWIFMLFMLMLILTPSGLLSHFTSAYIG